MAAAWCRMGAACLGGGAPGWSSRTQIWYALLAMA
jgi:hypothetical protein